MKILLVYPEYPATFWSFRHALPFISKKASFPPFGLLTVAAMLPQGWDLKLVDLTCDPLKDQDITWADYVFISAMSVQETSAKKVINRCNNLGKKIIAGGPLFTVNHENFPTVDHFILGEAENILPEFINDIYKNQVKRLYKTSDKPSLETSPAPLWKLVNMKKYAAMGLQFSRGCPFNCDFCNVTSLFGHQVRLKTSKQILAELENLYLAGWRGSVFFVDDNFIGNKQILKKEILPTIINWMEKRKHPFAFNTQASINLADDEELMRLMVRAGFDAVFIGIETPNEASLTECKKFQNRGRDLVACVKKIQKFGLEVQAGFILGFDNDPPTIFDKLTFFIQKSGIATAMVGLLNAPQGTKLWERLFQEKRLTNQFTGNNTDLSLNFIPKMNQETLLSGYKKVVSTIYSPKEYYKRAKTFLKNYKPLKKRTSQFHFYHFKAFLKSIWYLGLRHQGRRYYWKLLAWSFFRHPRLFPLAVTLSIYGFHFRKVFANY